MKEILVLGAGYAGLKTVTKLQKKAAGKCHITLVDKNDYHYEATDLHEVAAGTEPKEKISYPIKDVLNTKVTTFIQDEVLSVDPANKQAVLKNNGTLKYDYCVVSLGFVSETFGIPGALDNALQMVNIETAENIHNHIVKMMQSYQETKDPELLNIVVCGAGFTGIELAGALIDARPQYAKLAGVTADEINIIVVEAATRLLPMFSEKMADYGVNLVKKLGVKLMTGCMIKEIKPGQVLYQVKDGEETTDGSVAAKTIIWTTGVSGSPVMRESGFNERRGRVIVSDHLTDPEHDDVYILGDVAAFMDKETNRPYPTTAQIATRMGAYTADDIAARLDGSRAPEFSYQSAGTVASVGNTHAFGLVGKNEIKGYPASVVKKMIMNKSLMDIGGVKELLAKGRFDLYH